MTRLSRPTSHVGSTKKDYYPMPYPAPHEVYAKTIERMEPDLHMVDIPAAAASVAISLKRIADALDKLNANISYNSSDPNLYDLIERLT